jgi:hypothetical protein
MGRNLMVYSRGGMRLRLTVMGTGEGGFLGQWAAKVGDRDLLLLSNSICAGAVGIMVVVEADGIGMGWT